jgi:hypothetical protein
MKTLQGNLGRALLLLGVLSLTDAIASGAPDASSAAQEIKKKQKVENKGQKDEGGEKRELTPEEKAIKELKAERDRTIAKLEEDYQKALAEIRQGTGSDEAKETKKQELAKQNRDKRAEIMKSYDEKIAALKGGKPPAGDAAKLGETAKATDAKAAKPVQGPNENESKLLSELDADKAKHEAAMKSFAEQEKSIGETAKGDELASKMRELQAKRTEETARHEKVVARVRTGIGDKRFDELMAMRQKPK